MIYDVRHRTEIGYEQTVTEAHHVLHLMPRDLERQKRIAATVSVVPEPTQLIASQDYFGNVTHHLFLQEAHDRLVIESIARVDVSGAGQRPDLDASLSWEAIANELAEAKDRALWAQQFIFDSPQIATSRDLRDYASPCFSAGRPVLTVALDLTRRIYDEFNYEGNVSDVSTPVAEVLEMRRGVCQDFAHLEIACLRSFGLAARYVSGYLLTYPPPGQPRLVGADASHAWISVWAGDLGWVDFDPTNGCVPREEHITVGWGRDYSDVSPTNGFIVGGGSHEVKVSVDVSPVGAAAQV